MKKKFNLKNILLVSFLAMAGIFGISSAVIGEQKATEQPVMEKADAGGGTYEGFVIYWARSSSNTIQVEVLRGDGTDWATETMTKTGTQYNGTDIYTATVWEKWGGFDEIKFKDNGSVIHDITGWTTRGSIEGKLYTGSSWVTLSEDIHNYTIYADQSGWANKSTATKSDTPKLYWWDSYGHNADKIGGAKVTSLKGGGTYSSHTTWYSFSISTKYTLTGCIFYHGTDKDHISNSEKSGDCTSVASGNIYGTDGSTWGTGCSGEIYKFDKYRKINNESEVFFETDYVLSGEYYTPSKNPSQVAPDGCSVDSTAGDHWYFSDTFTGDYVDTSHSKLATGNNNFVIRAKYTATTYTITYYQNGSSGGAGTRTATKTHGVNIDIANPTSFSWAPSELKYFKYWSTDEHDSSGTTYSPGVSYTTNDDLDLYYIEAYWDYQVKIGESGSWVSMHYDAGGGLPSGVIGQFVPNSNLSLKSGDILYFQVNKHDGTGGADNWQSISFTYSGDGNNYSSGGVILGASTIVDLKVSKDNGNYYYDIWVPGLSLCSVIVGGTSYAAAQNGDQFETGVGIVEAKTGDSVQIAFGGTPGAKTYMTGGTSGCFTADADEGTVTCALTGKYTVYVVRGEGGYHDVVSIVRHDNNTANFLASLFNEGVLDDTCKTDGSTNPSSLSSAWSEAAAYFSGQPSAITSKFTDESSDSEILRMLPMYDYILGKYSSLSLTNFLSRPVSNAIRGFSPLNMFGDDSNNITTIIIVVASSVALLSVTALSILVIKKRKQKEE